MSACLKKEWILTVGNTNSGDAYNANPPFQQPDAYDDLDRGRPDFVYHLKCGRNGIDVGTHERYRGTISGFVCSQCYCSVVNHGDKASPNHCDKSENLVLLIARSDGDGYVRESGSGNEAVAC